MVEISILNNKEKEEKKSIVIVNSVNIPVVDVPYFVEIKVLCSGIRKIEFQFINNNELKDFYIDEHLKLEFGKKSGKIYSFELNEKAYFNSNKIKSIRKEVISDYVNNRFKNNISNGLELVREIFEKNEFI